MSAGTGAVGFTRRAALAAGAGASIGLAGLALVPARSARAGDDDAAELVERMMGRKPVESDRLRLAMPADFPNGYTVPMTLEVDSPMTEQDHVKQVRVLAPLNPIIEIVGFHFTPGRSVARVSTRVRLAKPQFVVAAAEMNDGTVLMTKTWVSVATDGCA